MREAIGSLSITQIVIFFLILFSGFMSVSINVNKAYKVRNEIITIIQKNNGFNEETLTQIQEYMTEVGYRSKGTCDADDGVGYKASGYGNATGNNALMCVKQVAIEYETSNKTKPQFPTAAYYQIKVFFSLDIPIINNVFRFALTGSTRKLFYPVTMVQ